MQKRRAAIEAGRKNPPGRVECTKKEREIFIYLHMFTEIQTDVKKAEGEKEVLSMKRTGELLYVCIYRQMYGQLSEEKRLEANETGSTARSEDFSASC